MDVFGSFALILAFVCAVYAFVGGIAAIITRHPLLIKSARQAGIAVCGLIFTATLSLVYLFFTDNYSVVYVVSVLLTYRNKNGELMPYVGVILAGVQLFFLTISNFVASPFKVLGVMNAAGNLNLVARADGNGLNPVLQYPEMVIHPPNLYSGYTGFTIPFAFALAALLARYPGEKWIHLTRKWTMIAWCFQTMGILLGAHWAYAVLGWGGYWGWDPVENASLLPWLTGTAFLHSVMMQEKRGMMKVWNVWLVFSTFMLCILGTLLTRSGVVSSVHAFAQSCIAVLSGTLFPVFSEWLSGSRISVGAPFFNKVNIPIGLLLLFLTGVGPLLAWRKTSTDSLKRNFGWPLIAGLLAGIVVFALGVREFFSLVCLMLCVFVTTTIGMEFFRGARVIRSRSGASLLASAVDLTMRNTRRYGGYIVHMGMVLIFVGLAGAAFNRDARKDMQPGSTLQIGGYKLLLQGFDAKAEKNYTAERMVVEVWRDNKPLMMLYPERRFFQTNEQSGTMVAIYSTLREDLYVVYAGQNPETQAPVIHAFLNPLVKWIWLGGLVVVLGTLVTLLPNRRAVLVLAGDPERAAAQHPHALAPSVALKEGHD